MSKNFVVFLAAPWRLGTEETDWMDDGGGVVVGELWCSTRGLMRVCVCWVCCWDCGLLLLRLLPRTRPLAAREHFITYTTSFEAARWGRVYNIVREAHRGRKQQPGGRYVWRVTSHTFYNYKRTKTSKHAMFSSFWLEITGEKIVWGKLWPFVLSFYKKNFQVLTPIRKHIPQKKTLVYSFPKLHFLFHFSLQWFWKDGI